MRSLCCTVSYSITQLLSRNSALQVIRQAKAVMAICDNDLPSRLAGVAAWREAVDNTRYYAERLQGAVSDGDARYAHLLAALQLLRPENGWKLPLEADSNIVTDVCLFMNAEAAQKELGPSGLPVSGAVLLAMACHAACAGCC